MGTDESITKCEFDRMKDKCMDIYFELWES